MFCLRVGAFCDTSFCEFGNNRIKHMQTFAHVCICIKYIHIQTYYAPVKIGFLPNVWALLITCHMPTEGYGMFSICISELA